MLAFTVHEKRVVLQVEIGVFTRLYESINRFIVDVRDPSAFLADDLHVVFDAGDQLIFGSCSSSLAVRGVQDLRGEEQAQCVIDCSDGYTLRLASFRQLVGCERLREEAHLLQDHLTNRGHAHVLFGDIGVEPYERCVVWIIAFFH